MTMPRTPHEGSSATPRGSSVRGAGRNLRVDVHGKGIPLITLIVDKLASRGTAGVAANMRKAFSTIDRTGRGIVTFEQMQELLNNINLHVSAHSLRKLFVEWTGGSDELRCVAPVAQAWAVRMAVRLTGSLSRVLLQVQRLDPTGRPDRLPWGAS